MISTFISLPLNTISIIIEYYQLFYMFNISSIWHGFEVMIMFSTICEIWSGIQFFINQFIQIKYDLNKYEKMIVHYETYWDGIENWKVCFDSLNILYSLSVTTLRNLREKEVCCWIVSRCILVFYSTYWLLVMRVFIVWMTKNRW